MTTTHTAVAFATVCVLGCSSSGLRGLEVEDCSGAGCAETDGGRASSDAAVGADTGDDVAVDAGPDATVDSGFQMACPEHPVVTEVGDDQGRPSCELHAPADAPLVGPLALHAGPAYTMLGSLHVGGAAGDGVLRADAGVALGGSAGNAVIVHRGSRIELEGSVERPVVIGRGLTLAINGRAPLGECLETDGSVAACDVEHQLGDLGVGGGGNPADDSGVLRYVRFQEASAVSQPALSLHGVGSTTTLEYLSFAVAETTALRITGGAAGLRYVRIFRVASRNGVDLLYSNGWRGGLQFAVLGSTRDGISGSGERSDVILSNLTLVGPAEAPFSGLTVLGGRTRVHNSIVVGYDPCLRVDEGGLAGWTGTEPQSVVTHSIFDGCASLASVQADDFSVEPSEELADALSAPVRANAFESPRLRNLNPDAGPFDLRPAAGSPALGAETWAPDDPFFEAVDFRGAFGEEDWSAGWALP